MGFKKFPEEGLVESQYFLSASSKDTWPQCTHSFLHKRKSMYLEMFVPPLCIFLCAHPNSTPPVLSVLSGATAPLAQRFQTSSCSSTQHGHHCWVWVPWPLPLTPHYHSQQPKPKKSLNLPVSLFTVWPPAWVWLSWGRHLQHKILSLLPSAEVCPKWSEMVFCSSSLCCPQPQALNAHWGGFVRPLRLPPQGYHGNADTSAEIADMNRTMQSLVSDNFKKKPLFLMSVVEKCLCQVPFTW